MTAALALLLARDGAAAVGSAIAGPESKRSFGQRFVAGRLSLGLQFTHFWLIDDRRVGENGLDNDNSDSNFLGSLWGLDAVQHAYPTPFLDYRVAGGFGLGVAYDEARAKTLDWANDDKGETAGDGDLEIRGMQVSLRAPSQSHAGHPFREVRLGFLPGAVPGFAGVGRAGPPVRGR